MSVFVIYNLCQNTRNCQGIALIGLYDMGYAVKCLRLPKIHYFIPMAYCKKELTLLLMHWSYINRVFMWDKIPIENVWKEDLSIPFGIMPNKVSFHSIFRLKAANIRCDEVDVFIKVTMKGVNDFQPSTGWISFEQLNILLGLSRKMIWSHLRNAFSNMS